MNNKTKIEQVIKLYKENFPMGWINNFDWDDEHRFFSLGAVRDKIAIFEQNTFFLFSQSILSGEYILRPGVPKSLDDLYDLFSNGEDLDEDINQYKAAAFRSFNLMGYELSRVIRAFRYLLTILENKYEEKRTKYIVNAYRIEQGATNREGYGRLYDILMETTRIDHLLSYDEGIIQNLIIYHKELKEVLEDKNLKDEMKLSLEILNEKCLFLMKKLLIDDNKVFDFMINFKHEHYDTGGLPFKYFSDMDKMFEFYRTENYSNDPIGRDLDWKFNKNELSIGQYTLLMKYYKDSSNTRRSQIDNILSDFLSLYERLSSLFVKRSLDKYSLGTLKNYMYNCRFSFMMQETSCSFDQLKEGLDEIMDIQSQTGILNFYPYRKACQKALGLLHASDSLEKNELVEYKAFIQLCISKFSEAIRWCQTNYFYPIQNVYQECLVPVAGFGAVFIASSFSRPVRYDKLIDELNTFKNQALLMDNEIALREEKKELKKLKNDIDNSRTRELEILSVFTAIVTFLFGSIGFFANNEKNDFLHLFFSVFGLGAILMIFVSGIHLLTMRKENEAKDYFSHPRMLFCLFTILASVALIIWLVAKVEALEVK